MVIRKLACVVLAAALSAVPLQDGLAQRISLGVEGGLSIADIGGDFGEELDSRTSFAVGVLAQVGVASMFSVQPEVLYTEKGGKDELDDLKVKLRYIQVPVLVAYNIAIPNSPITPRIYAGPAVAFKVSCDLTNGGSVDCDDAIEEEGLEVESIDYGVVFGGGVNIGVGNGAVTADVRYDLGLADVVGPIESGGLEIDGSNRAIQFFVGYVFPLGL